MFLMFVSSLIFFPRCLAIGQNTNKSQKDLKKCDPAFLEISATIFDGTVCFRNVRLYFLKELHNPLKTIR